MPVYIIEHLEPKLWPWVLMEYKHISKLVSKSNLWFTNIKTKHDADKLKEYGKIIPVSVSKLNLKHACILDPESKQTLTPKLAKQFNYFIFGGILGDYPPRKRTRQELTSKFKHIPAFNIGKEQMSTDNAVYTVGQIIQGKPLNKMKFQDELEVKINKIESIILPYRYNLVNGKPFVSQEVVNYLKRKKNF
jgi:ribosome biogenesis SPOUT family RNA methylase Rps3